MGYIAAVIRNIIELLNAKTRNINASTEAIRNGSLNDKIVDTTNLLLIVDSMIRVEIIQIRSTHMSLNQPYEILKKLDKDIEMISTNVHDSLKAELFNDPNNMIITSAYLEKYIVNTVTTELIAMVKQLNQDIAERNLNKQ
jgi:hypothetical protein